MYKRKLSMDDGIFVGILSDFLFFIFFILNTLNMYKLVKKLKIHLRCFNNEQKKRKESK